MRSGGARISRMGATVVTLVVVGLLSACGGSGNPFLTTSTTGLGAVASTSEPGGDTGTTGGTAAPGTTGEDSEPSVTMPTDGGLREPSGEVLYTERYGRVDPTAIMVIVDRNSGRAVADQVADGLGGSIVGSIPRFDLFQIEVAASSEGELAAFLTRASEIEGVDAAFLDAEGTLDDVAERCSVFDERVYSDPDGNRVSVPYRMIGLEAARRYIEGSGINIQRAEDLIAVLDFFDDDPGVLSHGDGVTNVINGWSGGVARNVAGVPSEGVEVLRIGSERLGVTLEAIDYAVEHGRTVINISMGWLDEHTADAFREVLERLYEEHPDVLIVAAAGNEDIALDGSNSSPGGIAAPNLITVGALNLRGRKAGFSNYEAPGGEVTLAAPGVGVLVDDVDGTATQWGGTSVSAPQVAAAAALLKALDPSLTADEIKGILVATADREISDAAVNPGTVVVPESLGAGVLRLDEAIFYVLTDEDHLGLEIKRRGLIDRGGIYVTYEPGAPLEYTITATVEWTVSTGGLALSVWGHGDGQLIGEQETWISGPDSVGWTYIFEAPGQQAELEIYRSDNDACAVIHLNAEASYPGTYWGTIPGDLMSGVDAPDIPISFVVAGSGIEGTFDLTSSFEIEAGATVTLEGGGSCSGLVEPDGRFNCDGEFTATGTASAGGVVGSTATNTGTWVVTGVIDADGNLTGSLSTQGSNSSVSDIPVTAARE